MARPKKQKLTVIEELQQLSAQKEALDERIKAVRARQKEEEYSMLVKAISGSNLTLEEAIDIIKQNARIKTKPVKEREEPEHYMEKGEIAEEVTEGYKDENSDI